jgi:2-C-methyl-D-erythritol 4-phosphate cytidylyltransferase
MPSPNRLCHAVLPSAGMGARLGGDQPKQFRHLAGKPMLLYALDAFFACKEIHSVWVGMSAGSNPLIHDLRSRYPYPVKRFEFLETGGPTRQQTVLNTLAAMLKSGVNPNDWVLVHDAARPGITSELIERLITLVKAQEQLDADNKHSLDGGLLAMPVADTMKETTQDAMRSQTTIDRSRLWQAQTPQMFPLKALHDALSDAIQEGANITDEASAIERAGGQPLLVEGATRNFKVTHPADWDLMELVLSARR